jgi:CubicO group peptidase (beta-lactamase class C family)
MPVAKTRKKGSVHVYPPMGVTRSPSDSVRGHTADTWLAARLAWGVPAWETLVAMSRNRPTYSAYTLSKGDENNHMKTILSTVALAFACLSTGLSCRAAEHTSAVAGSVHGNQQRIQRIENGLQPAILIKGRAAAGMNLQERMKHYKVPGVSIAFFEHDKIIWARTYGFADVAKMTAVSPKTLFQAASISKPVSTLAMLRLVQEGKLSLDENVNLKLKSWKVPDNEFTKEQKVTLRRIVSHSAGLTVHGFAGYRPDATLPTLVQILDGQTPANSKAVRVDAVPGTKWNYSGGGFVVMQLLMTELTGKSFPELLNEKVLQPIGMLHSTFALPLPEHLKSTAATAYDGEGKPIAGDFHVYPEMAAAGLWTTPSDLARAAIEIEKANAGTSRRVLSQAMAHQMLTRQKDNWGLGIGLSPPGHPLRFEHGGSNEGFRCDLRAFVDSGQGVVVMTNADGGDGLIGEIERAVAEEYAWPDFKPEQKTVVDVEPATLAAYVGSYLVGFPQPNSAVHLTTGNGSLFLQTEALGPEPIELFGEAADQFFAVQGFGVTLHKVENGAVTSLTVHFHGQDIEAKKIP